MVISRFISVVWVSRSFLFNSGWYQSISIGWIYSNLFIHSPINGRLSGFPLPVFGYYKKIAINTREKPLYRYVIFLKQILKSGMTGSHGRYVSKFL